MGECGHFAPCPLGLEEVLVEELRAIGASDIEPVRAGARFIADLRTAYDANLWLRSAIRVQRELATRTVRNERALYEFVRSLPWEQLIDEDGTLAVDAALRDSFLTHSQYAAQLVKDGIVDRFRDRTGRRPDVDLDKPDLPVRMHLRDDVATMYADLSGESLHKRGYRPIQVKTPLNEALAAGLLLASDWDRATSLVDPMCGSATFVIEAAWIAGDRAPGLDRRFAFQRWKDFEPGVLRDLRRRAERRAKAGRESIPPLEAADRHGGALGIARESAERAGVRDLIRFTESEVASFDPALEPRFLVVNPPYGERVGEGDDLIESWVGLGDLFRRCTVKVAWVLSGSPELTQNLRMRASRKLPVRNGNIDCRFLRYEIDQRPLTDQS